MTDEPNAYEDAKELVKKLDINRFISEKGNPIQVRNAAAKYAQSLDENAVAESLSEYEYPIEYAHEKLGIEREGVQRSLETLVKGSFDGILSNKNVTQEKLEQSLLDYVPRKDLKEGYDKLAQTHRAKRNIALYDAREKIDPREAERVLAEMTSEVFKYYDNNPAFNPQKGDSDEVKEHKQKLKNFYLKFVIGKNPKRPREEGLLVRNKYIELHVKKIKEFDEKLNSKSALVDYVNATLPEDSDTRIGFLRRITAGDKEED